MIYPTLDQLNPDGKYNRYAITIAAAKGARMVTDEYVAEREIAEQMVARKDTDKPLAALIDKELRDEKAVHTSVYRMMRGEIVIVEEDEKVAEDSEGAEEPVTDEEAEETTETAE